ncbi:MAG: transporter substrate-binding domain-containing protein [Burkholderiales bacterium]|nr:transporter substrate-binding domain-containing protein [Burkholderiales bacterium]
MHARSLARVLGVLYLFIQAGFVHAAGPLVLLTEEKPPRQMLVNGKLTGSVVEKLRLLMAESGIDYRMDVMPWARALATAKSTANTCVFSTARNAEREPWFQWVGPIVSTRWTLYRLAASNIQLASLDDARPYRIGTYNKDVRDAFLRERGFTVDAAPVDADNVNKLLAGRIDLWAEDELVAARLLKERSAIREVVPVLTFNKLDGYLACSLGTSRALVDKLGATWSQLSGRSAFAQIDEEFTE